MSERSFRRARARRIAREHRRLANLKRRGALAAGAALTTSALFAANAQAATYVVNTNADDASGGTCNPSPGTCTLRDAISSANGDSSADTITFAPSLDGQMITLTNGALSITDSHGLTITGPGAGSLSVSGGGNSAVFDIGTGSRSDDVEIDDLTITDGSNTSHGGGAIDNGESNLTLNDDVISGSTSADEGGGIYSDGPLYLTGTTVSGNNASDGGGIYVNSESGEFKYNATITNSTISGNTASEGGGIEGGKYLDVTGSRVIGNKATDGSAGGIDADGTSAGIHNTTVSGNTASASGGGIESDTKYGTTITGSTLRGNTASGSSGIGGGLEIVGEDAENGDFAKYNPVQVEDTTISGNTASGGAGVGVGFDVPGTPITISHSTLSGNTGGADSIGGGLFLEYGLYSPFKLLDSTISGNSATQGGGIGMSYGGDHPLIGTSDSGKQGSVTLDSDTIAQNSATGSDQGGGIYLGQYNTGSGEQSGTVSMASTIVSGNKAAGAANDLARPSTSTSGGFDAAFDLLEAPGNAPLLTSKNDITGQSAQLNPLQNNGGPTKTMMPAGSSPVIAQGHDEDNLKTDQRGQPRTIPNPFLAKPPGGDSTDIGAVELPTSAVAPTGFTASIHGKTISSSHPLLLVGNSTSVKCSVKIGTLTSCDVNVPGYAKGSATSKTPVTSLRAKVALTQEGKSALKNRPLGAVEVIQVSGLTSRSRKQWASGSVRVLGPSITLGLPAAGQAFSDHLNHQLQRVAQILSAAKSITCTAYSGSGSTAAEASSQAKKACTQITNDGYSGTVQSAGKADSHRRLVITFKF